MATRFLFIFIFIGNILQAQDSTLLSKSFQFEDGIYLTFNALQNNQPTFAWEEVQTSIFTNPQTLLTQISEVLLPNGFEDIQLNTQEIFAISIAGVPYMKIEENEIKKDLTTFAALKVRGKICYFGFTSIQKRQIEMQAFNPKNGRPFRSSMIEREVEVFQEKLLDFETGVIENFTVDNFLKRIQKDDMLVQTMSEMTPAERQKKLFKCLLIFDDRNHFYFKK